VADEQKAPVAIRITRPYTTEQEFLEREFDTLTRTSVILLGAQPRPQGVVLRFEIVLKGGESVLRGEGRVVAHKEKAHAGEPGLTLRFTRLDARSKALVDRASALRDARAKASISSMSGPAVAVAIPVPPPAPSSDPIGSLLPESIPPPSSSGVDRAALRADAPSGLETSRKPGPPPLPPQMAAPPPSRRGPPPLPPSVPAPASGVPSSVSLEEIENTQVDASFHRHEAVAAPAPARAARAPSQAPRPPTKARTPPPPAVAARPRSQQPPPGGAGPSPRTVERPREREALLHRLRARGQALPASRVGEILTKRVAR